MLSLLMMEVFTRILRRMEGAGIIKVFKVHGVGGDELCVSHLLFADDIIPFGDTSVSTFFILGCC